VDTARSLGMRPSLSSPCRDNVVASLFSGVSA
jgi:hypothetical protein